MAVLHLHIKYVHISLSSPELLTFFSEIQDGGRRHLGFSGYENLAIPTWHLCSVPNLVRIYVMVTEIDALMLKTFI